MKKLPAYAVLGAAGLVVLLLMGLLSQGKESGGLRAVEAKVEEGRPVQVKVAQAAAVEGQQKKGAKQSLCRSL
ncbi:MAG: hypothetical protein HC904_11305 [Blastochloris sp.]|nr:hypothetical protein [Blastochloris sp.]